MSTPYADEVLAKGPAAFWTFEEPSGSVLADSSGNGHDLTVYGATLGQVGPGDVQAVAFDGVDDYLQAAGWSSVDTSIAWTYEVWARCDAIGSVDLMGQYYAGSRNHPPQLRVINDDWAAYRRQTVGTSTITHTWPRTLGAWTHLVYTHDGTTGRFYVDGVERSTVVDSDLYNETSNSVQLGYVRNGYLNGLLAAPAIYPRALSAAEVVENYDAMTAGAVPSFTGTAAWSEDDDTAAADGSVVNPPPVPAGITVTVDGTSLVFDGYEVGV